MAGLNGKLEGLGAYLKVDLNTVTTTGYWSINRTLFNNSNLPTNISYGGLITFAVNGELWVFQMVFNLGGETWCRARSDNGIWSEWTAMN